MKTALIFAAGRGERLKPFTDHTPKALCLVHNRPLIEHHVRGLAAAGFQRILINHAHLGDQIRRHLGDGARFNLEIIYLAEPPGALETGGAVVNALPYLNDAPFVTVSADIFTDFDWSTLQAPRANQAHLILVPTHGPYHSGDFGLTSAQCVSNTPRTHVFANIACFDPALFQGLPWGRYPIAPLLRQWVTQHRVTGEVFLGKWFNVGTQDELTDAREA